MRETFDASIGGRKGLLYVGYGPSGGDTEDTATEGTMIRFVRGDGEVPMSFDVSRLMSCDAKGRYRMIVVYEEDVEGEDGGEAEKQMAIVRVYNTAVDRVIGVVLDLAERAEAEAAEAARNEVDGGSGGEQGGGQRDVAVDGGYSTADAMATVVGSSSAAADADAGAPDGTAGTANAGEDGGGSEAIATGEAAAMEGEEGDIQKP